MKFNSQNIFDDYINSLKGENADNGTRTVRTRNFNGFTSLNDLKDRIVSTRSDENDEEGSEEEYRLSLCEQLIPDELLTNVLDTTMRIIVEDKFYKITKHGTFYTDKKRAAEIDNILVNFDVKNLINIDNDLYSVKDGVFLYDTFGVISGDNNLDTIIFEEENSVQDSNEPATRSSSLFLGTESQNTNKYGLTTYKWSFKFSVNGYFEALKTFFGLFGKDITRENKFDKNRRIQCNLFQTNYVYYATTGFKVKMQKRKKIWFVSYWVGTRADDIVIGIEELSGQAKINHYNTNRIANYGQYLSTYMGGINNMIYGGLGKPTFVEDWLSTQADIFFPGLKSFDIYDKWKFDPWSWTTKNLTKRSIYAGLRFAEGRWINKPAGKHFRAIDPKMALVYNGNGKIESHIMGIQSYGSRESKTIRFSQAGGFTLSVGGSITGYIPETFNIENVRIFGAVKYNNQWRGIRFYKN